MTRNPYHRQFIFSGQALELVIIRSKRKTLAFHVMPGRQPAEVRVPLRCAWQDIEQFINDRLEWWYEASKQLEKVPEPPRFLDGTSHEYLGKPTTLEVVRSRRSRGSFDGEKLRLFSKQPDCHKTNQAIFHDFVREESKRLFPGRLEACVAQFPEDVFPKGLRIRRMKARWGSCSQTGEICLNSLLLQKALTAIDLVITHELCHLKHFRHDKAFYSLLTRAMPDWRDREAMLLPMTALEREGASAGSDTQAPTPSLSDSRASLDSQLTLF